MRVALLLVICLSGQLAWGQFGASSSGDMPPNVESGKCYAKCLVKDEDGNTGTSYSEWREIICTGNVTSRVVRDLRAALYYEGFLSEEDSRSKLNVLDEKLRSAMVAFQKSVGIPAGALDLETLRQLEVEH